MRSFLNLPVIVLVAGLAVAPMSAADGETAKTAAPENAAATPAATAGGKKADAAKDKDRLDFPVPKGQLQKGIRIPIFSPEGKLLYTFQIGVAEVVDEDHIKLGVAHVETFRENGEHEYDIDLSDSVLNQKTHDLTSNVHVTIKRREFELSGNSVTFNLRTKIGKLGNGVKMVIYDASATFAKADGKPEGPTIEVKPVKEKQK